MASYRAPAGFVKEQFDVKFVWTRKKSERGGG